MRTRVPQRRQAENRPWRRREGRAPSEFQDVNPVGPPTSGHTLRDKFPAAGDSERCLRGRGREARAGRLVLRPNPSEAIILKCLPLIQGALVPALGEGVQGSFPGAPGSQVGPDSWITWCEGGPCPETTGTPPPGCPLAEAEPMKAKPERWPCRAQVFLPASAWKRESWATAEVSPKPLPRAGVASWVAHPGPRGHRVALLLSWAPSRGLGLHSPGGPGGPGRDGAEGTQAGCLALCVPKGPGVGLDTAPVCGHPTWAQWPSRAAPARGPWGAPVSTRPGNGPVGGRSRGDGAEGRL